MNTSYAKRHRTANRLQTVLILTAMAGVLALLGGMLFQWSGVLWAVIGGTALLGVNPMLSPGLILRLYRARPLDARSAPELHGMIQMLAERADLATPPRLHYVASPMINAFAVGTARSSAIAVTGGLLSTLTLRELFGVLAHEVSHVTSGDTKVMMLADLFSRLTHALSTIGQFLLLLSIPMLLFSELPVRWPLILALIFAPTVSVLLQLALSRTREFDADIVAVELTGDPEGLASALAKMERYQGRFMEQVFLPGRRVPEPSLLRTHPDTEERVRRLLELTPRRGLMPVPPSPRQFVDVAGPVHPRPRWRVQGIWY